ncbi:hypothetical protein NL676_026021 [Syzygium grande]|nr:hypothetical protein NL676_026021 [Syzygium grande]
MGSSDYPAEDSSAVPAVLDGCKIALDLKAIELRLGLPGFQSPERDADFRALSSAKLEEKPFFPLHPPSDADYSSQKNCCLRQ